MSKVSLWIDALCINQSDLGEKSTQIARMGRIYSQAKGTIAYIGTPAPGGPDEDDPGAGFRALAWFGNATIIKPPEGIPADQSDARFQEWYRSYTIERDTKPPEDFSGALTSLFANDWFIRCWVIQKMVLSRETVCLYGFGDNVVSWALGSMAMLIERGQSMENHRRDLNTVARNTEISGAEKAVQVDSWRVLREDLKKQPSGLSIFELLRQTRFAKATDIRDKVYSLMGLMNEEDAPAIRVDYSDSYTAAHLYRDVAIHCMSYPDCRPPEIQDTNSASTSSSRNTSPDIFVVVLSAIVICSRQRERHPTGYPVKHENWPDVVWRTCCMDRNWTGKRVTARDRLSFHASMKRWGLGEDIFAAVKPDETTGEIPVQSARRLVNDSTLREAALDFELMVIEWQGGRTLGMTAGGLIGSFPSTVRAGDVVVVLFGGWVPFVLRPVGEDVFELVGACYVHGIMDGEWVKAAAVADNSDLLKSL